MDFKKDSLPLSAGGEAGKWAIDDGDVVSGQRGNNTLWLPLQYEGDYSIRTEFTRIGSPDRISLVLPIGDMQRILTLHRG